MIISEIEKSINLFKPDNALIEVRSFSSKSKTGYFKNKVNLLKHLKMHQNDTWYFVMNEIKEECYGRDQNEKIIQSVKTTKTTADKDIAGIDWILIDVDPQRAVGISSSDEEKLKAKEIIAKIYKFLQQNGFSKPVLADSGNGYHLLYNVSFNATLENTELVKTFLQVLDMFFSDEKAKVDISVFNPSRITKLYGTVSRKGSNIEGRPHRPSFIINIPTIVEKTSINQIKKIADMMPKPEKQNNYKNYNGQNNFDLRDFMSKHGIRVDRESSFSDGTKFVLEECVFDPQHKSPDSAILLRNDGVICYHCFHDSCSRYTWKDVRLKFEPDAYDFKEREQYTKTTIKQEPRNLFEVKEQGETKEKFLNIADIKSIDRSQIVSIPTGFNKLDNKIIGFNKGEMSVWSGFSGSAKSTVLNQLAIEAVEKGFKVAMFSGELTPNRVKNWLHLQCAGKQHLLASQFNNDFWIKSDIKAMIDNWLKDKLWLYDNKHGMNVEKVLDAIGKHVKAKGIDVVIIDNLMSLDIRSLGNNKYDNQTHLALYASEFAKKHDVHLHFVCHPRKPTGFLRKADISGTADITNVADNVMLVHRVNNDFKRYSKEFFNNGEAEKFFDYSNVLEIAKNRDRGYEDVLIGLYFETESKRLLNEPYEKKAYGWEIEIIAKLFEEK